MNNEKILSRAEPYRRKKRRTALWKRIVAMLGCAVLFVTTYVLSLPASTLDDPPICGFEEHRHDSSCYMMPDPVSQLSCSVTPHQHTEECEEGCGYSDFFLHSHSTDNGDNGHFVCRLPELEEHAHTDECYTESVPLVCGLEESDGHTHSDGCFTEVSTLTCTKPETAPHTHEDTCYGEDGALLCTVAESEDHTHSEACYTMEPALTCEIPEAEGHTHSDTCLGEPESVLTCTEPEYTLHTHTDECFDEDGVWICGIVELVEHVHGESCLAITEVQSVPVLICERTEHIHSDACYPAVDDTTATTGETESTTSTDPTDSTLVTAPTDSTLVTDPTDSTLVTDPTESTLVTEPADVTDPTDSTLVTEPAVLEVIEKIAVIYTDETYAEVSTDTTVITVTGLIPADAEIRAYPVTIQSDKDVLCAYDLTIFLPDGTVFEPAEGENLTVSIMAPELSGEVYYIPEDGEPELIDTTITEDGVKFDTGHFSVYAVMATDTGLSSEEVPAGVAGSYWHSTAYPNYQVSPMRFRRDSYAYWTETFILISEDEYGGKTWTPDSTTWTAAGNHNYYVTYCADIEHEVSNTGGVHYIYKSLLSETAFTAEQQAALRRIITNSYPFITQEEMVQRMTAAGYTGTFNPTVLIYGIQKAIWHTTNGVAISQYDTKLADNDPVLNPITITTDASEANGDKVYNFLMNAAVDTDPGNLEVSSTYWSENDDGSYTVTVTLNRTLLEGEKLEATLTNGDVTVTKTIEPGTNQFSMVWSAGLPETGNITLRLTGSRKAFNVYYYDDGGEYQNMIGGQYDTVELDYEEVLIRSTTNITVTKKWVETDSSTRPEDLTVYLTINGSHVVEEGISPIVLNESNNWTYTWENLPTSKNGKVLNYAVDEITPPGYSGRFVTSRSDGNKTITITNTQIPVELQTSLSVTKQWEDGNATHGGQAIIVHLYADGVYTGKDLVLSDATGWLATFEGLPYYQEDGVTLIEYTIVEEKVEGYVPDYGDTTPVPNVTTWDPATSLEAGSVYRFVSNGVALSCDESGNLTATTDGTEDKYQWWSVAKSGSSWTLTNVKTGKMVGFSDKTYVAANDGVALTFSNSRLSYKSGSFFFYTTYYLQLSEGNAATTTSSSSASTFTVYKKTSVDKVPGYNITLTNMLAPDYELPQTGGMGTEIFTFGGTALIATALMWGCSHKRKRERGTV